MSPTLLEIQPILNLVEVKAVAELLHLKLATLLLHSGKEGEAVVWMRQHVAFFRNKVGPPEGAFLHWAWLARQFQVFGEMLQQRLGSGIAPAGATEGGEGAAASSGADSVSERELLPAYYFQVQTGGVKTGIVNRVLVYYLVVTYHFH